MGSAVSKEADVAPAKKRHITMNYTMAKPPAIPGPMRSQIESANKTASLCGSLLVLAALLLAPRAQAQANNSPASSSNSSSSVTPAARSEDHFTWIEQFDGSSNTEGQVMLLDSSVGYLFGRHLLIDGGVPVYFVRANITTSSGASTTSSFTELGDVYAVRPTESPPATLPMTGRIESIAISFIGLRFSRWASRTPYLTRSSIGGHLPPTENSATSRPEPPITLSTGLA